MIKPRNRLHGAAAVLACVWLFGSIGFFVLMHGGSLIGRMVELLPFGAGRQLLALRDLLAPFLGAGFRE